MHYKSDPFDISRHFAAIVADYDIQKKKWQDANSMITYNKLSRMDVAAEFEDMANEVVNRPTIVQNNGSISGNVGDKKLTIPDLRGLFDEIEKYILKEITINKLMDYYEQNVIIEPLNE